MPQDDGISSKGFRVGIVKPMLEAELKFSNGGRSFSTEPTKIDDTLGLSLGYVNLPVQELGWTSNLSYMQLKNKGLDANLARLDGNVAYSFTQILNIKGGLNLSKFTSGEGVSKLDPSIGFQGGLGVQLTRNFGLDIGYTNMNQSATVDDVKVEAKESGIEIGLNGTF